MLSNIFHFFKLFPKQILCYYILFLCFLICYVSIQNYFKQKIRTFQYKRRITQALLKEDLLQAPIKTVKMSLQKQMIKFINVARQYPTYFVPLIQKQIKSFTNQRQIPLNQQIIYETNEGEKAWQEAIVFLKQQKSLPSLQQHEGLNSAARDHAFDLARNNIFGHTGSDGSTFTQRILRHCRKGHGSMAQLIGADFDFQNRSHAEMTILGLIIDDGVSDRGHRKTIFNSSYQYIGCKSEVQGQKIITIFNVTENKLSLRNQSNLQNAGQNLNKKSSAQTFQNTMKPVKSQAQQSEDRFFKSEFVQKSQYNPKEKPNKGLQSDIKKTNQSGKSDQFKSNLQQKQPIKDKFSSSFDNLRETQDKFSKIGKSGFRHTVQKLSKISSQASQNRKLCQKKQSSKIYYQQRSKITETTITFVYNDGTIQEKVEKHTVYLDD